MVVGGRERHGLLRIFPLHVGLHRRHWIHGQFGSGILLSRPSEIPDRPGVDSSRRGGLDERPLSRRVDHAVVRHVWRNGALHDHQSGVRRSASARLVPRRQTSRRRFNHSGIPVRSTAQPREKLMKHIFTLLTTLLLAPLTAICAADAPKQKPNVLFIVSDDLKPLLGCYGTCWIQSPNLDRLAAKGTVFTANYCQVAFCAPTRLSLLTGLRPDSTGVYLNPDQSQDLLRTRLPKVVTLPQQFKNHGYITHPLHKVFDGRTVDQGHDAASWTVPYGPWEMAPGEKPAPGGYQDPATKARLAEALKQDKPAAGPATEACDIPDNAYHDGGVAHTAAKRIREFARREQPFFLAVGFVKPHLPFIAPKKYWDLYDRAALPLAPFQQLPHGSPHDLAFYSHSGELRAYADIPKTGPIPEVQQRELIHGYAACVSYIDAQVGLLMQT
ncbi:MAG: hypothetical protein FJ271_33465, partial [Planctomycetes bacterium]|nr:hypothetical protein [Planctomycetota bacterium]